MKFYKIDDQIVISDKALSVGKELTANTTDGAQEKHVPVITVSGDEVKVEVGSVEHPSLEAHYIEFIHRNPHPLAEARDEAGSGLCPGGWREGNRCLRVLQPARVVDGKGISFA